MQRELRTLNGNALGIGNGVLAEAAATLAVGAPLLAAGTLSETVGMSDATADALVSGPVFEVPGLAVATLEVLTAGAVLPLAVVAALVLLVMLPTPGATFPGSPVSAPGLSQARVNSSNVWGVTRDR